MAKKVEDTTINIKQLPLQGHVGAAKFVNDDWKTIAFSFGREQLATKFADKELRYNGIYFLFGYEDGHEVVYVGQASKRSNGESFLARLREHNDSLTEKYRDKWSWVVVITNEENKWGPSELSTLESIFIHEIPDKNNLNGRKQNNAGADLRLYQDKVAQIKALITSVGFTVFQDISNTENIQIISEMDDTTVVEDLQQGMSRIPEIVTPQKIVKAMVDMLPAEVWNPKTVFVDPACKGGEYLREIYDRLMETEIMQSIYPNQIERSNHILKKQIYGIALSQVSLERTIKKLLGEDRNISIIPNYIDKIKGIGLGTNHDGSHKNIKDIFNDEFGGTMKIDVVIGNPPYNETDDTGSSKAINTYFVSMGIEIGARYMAFIMPDRWFVSPDKLNKNCRKSLVGKIRYMRDFDDTDNVFNGTSIRGGVSYFLYDKEYDGDMLYQDNRGSIKVRHNEKFMCKSTQSNILFNHVKGVTQKYMDEDYISTSFFGLTRNASGSIIDTDYYNIRLKSSGDDTFLNINDVPRNSKYIPLYKVTIPYSAMNPKPFILMPNEICTLTYLIVRLFNNITEAENCKKYFETNFFKVLFGGLKTKLGSTKENFMCIPLQDFTDQSDIDWSQTIADIDQQLYAKYNLTEEEILYIEESTKSTGNAKEKLTEYTAQDAMAAYVNREIQKEM